MPLALCAVCTGKEKVCLFVFFFPFWCVCMRGGISLLCSVTQRQTYLKIIVRGTLHLEALSVLDDKNVILYK